MRYPFWQFLFLYPLKTRLRTTQLSLKNKTKVISTFSACFFGSDRLQLASHRLSSLDVLFIVSIQRSMRTSNACQWFFRYDSALRILSYLFSISIPRYVFVYSVTKSYIVINLVFDASPKQNPFYSTLRIYLPFLITFHLLETRYVRVSVLWNQDRMEIRRR